MNSQASPTQPTAASRHASAWGRAVGTLWALIAHPTHALKQIADERRLLTASAVVTLSAWGWAWGAWGGNSAGLPSPLSVVAPFSPAVTGNLFFLTLLIVPISLAGWFLGAAVVHLIAEMWGGRGKALSLMATMGFAYLPLALLFPAALLCFVLGGHAGGVGVVTLWAVLTLLAHLWSLALLILAICEAHQLATGTAAGIVGLLLAVFGTIAVVLAFAAPSAGS